MADRVVFAGENARSEYVLPAPDVDESERGGEFRYLTLDALVGMKLTSYRCKDQVHILDMIDVGLIDDAWCDRLPSELAVRLRELLDNPEG